MSKQECEAKEEQWLLLTKTAMDSTHRQPPGCINTNTFRQASDFEAEQSLILWEKKKKVDCFKYCKGSYLCKPRFIS